MDKIEAHLTSIRVGLSIAIWKLKSDTLDASESVKIICSSISYWNK
jgi:hypothetical protein